MGIPAFYFDGRTSRMLRVELSVEAGIAFISGELQRQSPITELHVSERTRYAARKVTFPDGAYLEILDSAAFNELLSQTRHRESFVVRMQQSWRGTLAAVVVTLVVLVIGYRYGLPAAAEGIAKALPEKVERAIGQETLSLLDKSILAPSQLPVAQRDAIITRFNALTPPAQEVPGYRILFRKSKAGPNAFALPSGEIIVTDEIVKLVDNEDALMGILAHELGHLHERHIMRRLIQSSATGAIATVLFGDVSAVIANIPTVMLDMKYSRDAEREADDYAVALFKANGISLASLALVFEKLEEHSSKHAPYLSSHPPASERIERIQKAR